MTSTEPGQAAVPRAPAHSRAHDPEKLRYSSFPQTWHWVFGNPIPGIGNALWFVPVQRLTESRHGTNQSPFPTPGIGFPKTQCVCSVYFRTKPHPIGGRGHGPGQLRSLGLWAIPSTESGPQPLLVTSNPSSLPLDPQPPPPIA